MTMTILLPPSETKHPGGNDPAWPINTWALPSLTPLRQQTTDALINLSSNHDEALRTLKLGPKKIGEIEKNAQLKHAPTMPAIDRYTGVLYDVLEASTLDDTAREWLRDHVLVHTAPWGPIGALDGIPDYRMSATTTLPGVGPLRRAWSQYVTAALEAQHPEFIIDMRSEAYVRLGPVPTTTHHVYVHVVTETDDGTVRALNHFNKKAKGELVRALAQEQANIATADELMRVAHTLGYVIRATPEKNRVQLVAVAP
ncbi:YaaA family protein [Microbacterium sp. YY-01]|uniref:YaaA family protein n=1 Tax=Microbacterium sp. YY-01 TaxID=3421634 RepID=UPI003D1656A8